MSRAPLSDGREAILAFMRFYLDLPRDADVEVSRGQTVDAPVKPVLILRASHAGTAAQIILPTDDARTLADLCEGTLRRYPESELGNLILALRHGADQIDASAPAGGGA